MMGSGQHMMGQGQMVMGQGMINNIGMMSGIMGDMHQMMMSHRMTPEAQQQMMQMMGADGAGDATDARSPEPADGGATDPAA